MTTIDTNGALHDAEGKYAHQHKPEAGYDLYVGFAEEHNNVSRQDLYKFGAGLAIGGLAIGGLAACTHEEAPPVAGTGASLGTKWAAIGYGYAHPGATMDFSYTKGASSSLGAGISATGKAGTWKASGSYSVASTGTVDFPEQTSFKVWKSQFKLGKYHVVCFSPNGLKIEDYRVARVNGWAGGAAITTVAGAPTANYCTTHAAGTSFTKASSAAYTGTGGWETSGLIGVNLSAKTGYTSSSSIKFKFSKKLRLCGTNDYPGGAPVRLVAKP